MSHVKGVEVFNWNPRRKRAGPTLFPARVNNFGDLIGPFVASKMLMRAPLARHMVGTHASKLLAVGSIMHFADDGDVVWGSGVNGKITPENHRFDSLDVRAVRGPRTREWLATHKGIEAPEVYGDPALLIPSVAPSLKALVPYKRRRLSLIPNLNEVDLYSKHAGFVDPRGRLMTLLKIIATSEYVVGSSLHAIIVAEALGVPCALLRSGVEPAFKYEDYFLGTGRSTFDSFSRLEEAIEHAAGIDASCYSPLANWDATRLIDAFPLDLWRGTRERPPIAYCSQSDK